MPHSGGGGCSGGGYHGGSHHGTHGGSGNGSHYSNKPFKGARRYVYYRHYTPIIFYSDIDPAQSKPSLVLPLILLGLMAGVACFVILLPAFHSPAKNTKTHEEIAYIDDQSDVLTDDEETELKSLFEEFNNKAGVMPALVTVDYKTDLENFALDYYSNTWDDESHWLIAYCSKAGTAKTNWKFEIAQGYDTDDILYESIKERYFGDVLCDALDGDSTVGESFIKSFNTLIPELLKTEFYLDRSDLVFFVAWETIVIGCAVVAIFSYKKSKAMQKAKPMEENADIEPQKCPYCGTTYYKGISDHCIKCGHVFADEDFGEF